MTVLNLGCGERTEGDVRLDIRKTKAVNIIADAHLLPFRDNVFDKIICTEVLEHLISPFNALREARRILKRRGILIITVPNLTELRRILSIARHPLRVRRLDVDHKQGWDAIELHRLMHQVGLKVLEVKWLDLYGRKNRKEPLSFLNPLLEKILPPPLFYTHLMFITTKE